MKTYTNLWERLNVETEKLDAIRRDWSEGKVPDLPFYIVGQSNLKKQISEKLSQIDGSRMETSMLQAQYGDGKTNVYKYLELYFTQYADSGVKFIYCRANHDETDLCLFLMQHIQVSCLKMLRDQIITLSLNKDYNVATIANNFEGDFAFVKEYAVRLFDTKNTEEDLNNLIYLGTGRLYSQGAFSKYGLQKLTNFNRKEIFVIFMNILASAGQYIVFAVDELEKINDKSSKRMAHYFTSYRELVDLFNKINGHYLITAITNAVDVAAASQPFFERIQADIIKIGKLKRDEEYHDLISLMAGLLNKNISENYISDLIGKIRRNAKIDNNRKLVQFISENLKNESYKETESLSDIYGEHPELKSLFESTKLRIEAEDGFSNLSRSFFDPLEYYLEALGYKEVRGNISKRDYQSFIDVESQKAFFFLFNDETKIKSRIDLFVTEKKIKKFVILVPKDLTVTHSELNFDDTQIDIVDYDPKDLFVLLNMFRWNFDKQVDISKLLRVATSSIFE